MHDAHIDCVEHSCQLPNREALLNCSFQAITDLTNTAPRIIRVGLEHKHPTTRLQYPRSLIQGICWALQMMQRFIKQNERDGVVSKGKPFPIASHIFQSIAVEPTTTLLRRRKSHFVYISADEL